MSKGPSVSADVSPGERGKSAGGAVWLGSHRTSPYEFFQYWIQTDDRDVEKFLLQLTLLPVVLRLVGGRRVSWAGVVLVRRGARHHGSGPSRHPPHHGPVLGPWRPCSSLGRRPQVFSAAPRTSAAACTIGITRS